MTLRQITLSVATLSLLGGIAIASEPEALTPAPEETTPIPGNEGVALCDAQATVAAVAGTAMDANTDAPLEGVDVVVIGTDGQGGAFAFSYVTGADGAWGAEASEASETACAPAAGFTVTVALPAMMRDGRDGTVWSGAPASPEEGTWVEFWLDTAPAGPETGAIRGSSSGSSGTEAGYIIEDVDWKRTIGGVSAD